MYNREHAETEKAIYYEVVTIPITNVISKNDAIQICEFTFILLHFIN